MIAAGTEQTPSHYNEFLFSVSQPAFYFHQTLTFTFHRLQFTDVPLCKRQKNVLQGKNADSKHIHLGKTTEEEHLHVVVVFFAQTTAVVSIPYCLAVGRLLLRGFLLHNRGIIWNKQLWLVHRHAP